MTRPADIEGSSQISATPDSYHPRPNLARSGSWMVGGRGLQMAVGFGANLALVRLLTPADFGHFAIVAASVGIVSSVVNLRLEEVLLRLPDRDVSGIRIEVFGTALMLEVGLILIGSIFVLALFGLLDVAAILLVIGSAAGSWVSAQSALYERKFEYRKLSVIQTSGQTLAQVVAVAGAALGMGAIVLYVRSLIQFAVTGTGLAFLGELRRLPLRVLRAPDRSLLWKRVRGFWGDGLLEQVFERLVIVATGLLVSERVTGYFYQARLLAGVPQSLLAPFALRIRMNQLAHHTRESRRVAVTIRSVGVTVVPLLGAAALAFWLADPLVPWLLGSGWEGTVPLFIAMLGLIPGLTLLDTIKAYFMAEGNMRPFLFIGRGGQYAGAVVTAAIAIWSGVEPARSLGFGVSFAYVVPVGLLVLWLLRQKSDGKRVFARATSER